MISFFSSRSMFSFKTSKIQKTFKFLIVDGILHCQQIMPIVHISRPWGASYPSISDDLALLTPIHPEVVASASKSLLDVSNLGKMSALSVSSPALAADLGGGFLWKRLARGGKAKQANSKTRLLEQQQQQQVCGQGSADTLSTQVSWSPTLHESWPVSNAFLSACLGRRTQLLGTCRNFFLSLPSLTAGPASSSSWCIGNLSIFKYFISCFQNIIS